MIVLLTFTRALGRLSAAPSNTKHTFSLDPFAVTLIIARTCARRYKPACFRGESE